MAVNVTGFFSTFASCCVRYDRGLCRPVILLMK